MLDEFVEHLKSNGYHPRSDKHSNALANVIVDDLMRHCEAMRLKAAAGQLVYDINFDVMVGSIDWNIDLVFGVPEYGLEPPPENATILRRRPISVEVGIEIKSVMTEHRKAIKNRKRDLEAHHEHLHNYNRNAIAGAVLVINAAGTFRSPLRPETTTHKNPERLVGHCVNELRAISTRQDVQRSGLETKCAIIVDCDNIHLDRTKLVTDQWAPQQGDPIYYSAFIHSICSYYRERFN